MRRTFVTVALALLAAASLNAATLTLTNVSAPSINCVFNTNCTSIVHDTTSPLTLPHTTGTGFLQTRTTTGETGSVAAGLTVYLYRVDLSGVTGTNTNSCIGSLSLHFGPTASLSFTGTNTTNTEQVFVVTNGALGSVGVSSAAEDSNGVVTLTFSTPVCPGESSDFIGLVSSNAPVKSRAVLALVNGTNIVAEARTPRIAGTPINCDFSALEAAIRQLSNSDIEAPNVHAKAGRRGALLSSVRSAIAEAGQGDAEGVLEDLRMISNKAGGAGKPWLTPQAAQRITALVKAITDCVNASQETP